MNKSELRTLGMIHRSNGFKLTPHDCITIDRLIIEECKKNADIITQSKMYKKMRGWFNDGWNYAHNQIVFAE